MSEPQQAAEQATDQPLTTIAARGARRRRRAAAQPAAPGGRLTPGVDSPPRGGENMKNFKKTNVLVRPAQGVYWRKKKNDFFFYLEKRITPLLKERPGPASANVALQGTGREGWRWCVPICSSMFPFRVSALASRPAAPLPARVAPHTPCPSRSPASAHLAGTRLFGSKAYKVRWFVIGAEEVRCSCLCACAGAPSRSARVCVPPPHAPPLARCPRVCA